MTKAWERLVVKLDELSDVYQAVKLLEWDQAVMMPPKGGPARARSIATLEGMAHSKLMDPELGELIGELEEETLEQHQTASLRVLKRDYERANRVPEDLVRALAETRGHAYQAWTEARPASDFSLLKPHLERMVSLKKEEADAVGWEDERYNALLDIFEPDMTTAEVETMFKDLYVGLKPVAESILEKVGPRPEFLTKTYDTGRQEQLCQWLVGTLGFDKESGRLDTSPHPFTLPVAPGDVRQTTRADANQFISSIHAAIHETGHALYEQGLPAEWGDLPVGHAPSLGLHESQSRLWENQIGRSRAFTAFLLPHLKEQWPSQLGSVTPDEFYEAANHPERSLIRVEADEVTYNLHLMLRFDIELALFRDELEVADLPEAWNDGMEKYVGIRPTNDGDGVLQDMHWSIAALGYYPTYTLGTLYSAAFYSKMEEDLGSLDAEIKQGDTSRVLGWMREKIHSQGFLYPAKELAARVLGEPISAHPFLAYIRTKYGELYDVTF